MILTDLVAQGVARGDIRTVVRRWERSRVRAGSTLRTSAGVIAIDAIEQVAADDLGPDDAADAGHESVASLLASLPNDDRPIFRIRVRWQGPDPRVALAAGEITDADVESISAALRRLDARSPRGPWTRAVLELVATHPGRRAGDLADLLGQDKDPFKLDVRKLKNLGLSLSLEVGYRLSPRGESYLAATGTRTGVEIPAPASTTSARP